MRDPNRYHIKPPKKIMDLHRGYNREFVRLKYDACHHIQMTIAFGQNQACLIDIFDQKEVQIIASTYAVHGFSAEPPDPFDAESR